MDNSTNKRRKWTPAEKIRIVVTGMQPGGEISDLCRQEGIHATQYYTSKKQLLGSAERVFERPASRRPNCPPRPCHPTKLCPRRRRP